MSAIGSMIGETRSVRWPLISTIGGSLLFVTLLIAVGAGVGWVLAGIAAGVLLIGVVWVSVAQTIAVPLHELRLQSAEIATGQTSRRLEPQIFGDAAEIADNFNRLSERLRRSEEARLEVGELVDQLKGQIAEAGELRTRYSHALAVARIGREIAGTLEFSAIADAIYRNLTSSMETSVVLLGILEGERIRFDHAVQEGVELEPWQVGIDDGSSLAAWTVRNGREVVLENSSTNYKRYISGFDPITPKGGDHASVLMVPMEVGDRRIGVIGICSRRSGAYGEHHLNVLKGLASYAAIAHDNASAYRELDRTHRELKEAQSHLVQSEKLASLGQLTAGIAHEINNPINFVSGNVGPLRRDVGQLLSVLRRYEHIELTGNPLSALRQIREDAREEEIDVVVDEIEALLRGIEDGASRTASIVRGLRNFSRLDESDLKMADLVEGLESTIVLLHNSIKDRIDLRREYGELPPVECYPGQLNQVFMNLLTNAAQAIDGEGVITVRTERFEEMVRISISDTGPGIPEEIRTRIFDPFFTTKDVGKGTGLGLSITLGIVQKHHGRLDVASDSSGTTFTIEIPLRQERGEISATEYSEA